MSRYISITFGPITRVISMAKTTRGIWAASYIFSYIAKQIISPFKDRTFLLPKIDNEMFNEKYNGAGIFPDRYIFKAEEKDFDTLVAQIDATFDALSNEIAPKEKDNAKQQLKDIFKIFFFENEFNEAAPNAIVKQCEETLSLIEQQDTFAPSVADSQNYLNTLFNGKNDKMAFLKEDAGIENFKSIVEISSGSQAPKKRYERYIAIVYSDGDSMGKLFSSGNVEHVALSEALLYFNRKAIDLINGFDGQPVFIGGDDLFFFAPIYNDLQKQSIFTLLQKLDSAFKEALERKGIVGPSVGPSISFGVSITYFKFPMFEAVDFAKKLLFDFAKAYNVPEENDAFSKEHYERKNNIVFSVQKHSGHTRRALLHKGFTETVDQFYKMLNSYCGLTAPGTDKNQPSAATPATEQEQKADIDGLFLHSVMHNLREHEAVLHIAVTDDNLLSNYFDNFYNEAVHESHKAFLGQLKLLLLSAHKEYQSPSAAIELAYALLQFIHLVNFDSQK